LGHGVGSVKQMDSSDASCLLDADMLPKKTANTKPFLIGANLRLMNGSHRSPRPTDARERALV